MSTAVGAVRRFFCLPPARPVDLAAGQARDAQPHTLLQTLYPLTLIFTVCYMILEFREFVLSRHPQPRFFTPETYQGFLGLYAGEQEIRRWKGRPDRYVLGAEFILYAWFIIYFCIAMTVNFYPETGYRMPKELWRICTEAVVVLCGVRASKYFRSKGR